MAITRVGRIIVIALSCWTAIVTIFVLARLLWKRSQRVFALDDRLLALALVLLYEQSAWGFVLATVDAEGKDFTSLTEKQFRWSFKAFYFAELSYSLVVTATRLSVLVSYERFLGHITWCHRTIWAVGVLCIIWFLATFISFAYKCQPTEKAFNTSIRDTCFNQRAGRWTTAAVISNAVIDWFILFLPIHPLRNVYMRFTWAKKALVGASFAFGLGACTASTLRAAMYSGFHNSAFSSINDAGAMSTHVEPMIGMISASLPFLTLGHYVEKAVSSICPKRRRGTTQIREGCDGIELTQSVTELTQHTRMRD